MLDFMGSWQAQTSRFDCLLSLAIEPVFDFDVDEPGSRRGAEASPALVMTIEPKLSERSEFFGSRPIVMTRRAPQGIRPFGPDGGLGDSFFAYFFSGKSKSCKPAQRATKCF